MADLETRLNRALKAGDKGDPRKANERQTTALRRIRALVSDAKVEGCSDARWDALLGDILAAVREGVGS